MIQLLLLLHLSSPSLVEQNVAQSLFADSISASESLLLPFRAEIESAAAREALSAALIAAVIQEESRFDPWATRSEPRYIRSRAVRRAAARFAKLHPHGPNVFTEAIDRSRSYGLMQIMGETAREQGFVQPFLAELYLPANAIAHGAMLLAKLLHRYPNDTLAAISAYNQGTARKRRGLFLNARYVYRVTIAWRAYDAFFKKGSNP
jgi:soluble lytic murein transglycosylase-like protein